MDLTTGTFSGGSMYSGLHYLNTDMVTYSKICFFLFFLLKDTKDCEGLYSFLRAKQ